MAKIWVVDDSRLMCRYLERVLAGRHTIDEWQPTSAMDIATYLLESAPDLVITDYHMPGCNGATVARMVMKARPGLPVIVITVNREDEVAETLRKFQVVEILHKPVTAAAVLEAVDRALDVSA